MLHDELVCYLLNVSTMLKYIFVGYKKMVVENNVHLIIINYGS